MANSSCVAASTTATVTAAAASPLKTPVRNPKHQSLRLLPPSLSSSNKKKLSATATKAAYSNPFWIPQPNQRNGVWSIREDLQLPASPYFPVEAQGGQGPPPMVQERFQSVISQLFQHRIIRCGGAVDDDMANIIVGQLLYLDAVDPTKDIVMYVNSPGGSVTAGMAVFDTMRHIRPDVSTVCVGLAARKLSKGDLGLCPSEQDSSALELVSGACAQSSSRRIYKWSERGTLRADDSHYLFTEEMQALSLLVVHLI